MTDPAPVLDLIEAFRRSKTMFAAVALGVFDGNRDLGAAGDRLLAACAALGLLEERDGEYRNTAVADEYLSSASPRTLAGYVRYSNRALLPMWEHLEEAVREGKPRWSQVFGHAGPLFDAFFETPEAKRDFLLGMHGFGQLSSPAVAAAFDLGRFRKLIDLGGATGHLARAARDRYPSLEIAVFDLPPAIEFAREFFDGERIAGDFFRDPLPPADLYALGRILHDWSEDKIRVLLAKVFAALPAGGAVLLAEKLLTPANVPAHMQSLNMMVCTEGRERTFEEYRALLETAGFVRVESRITGQPLDAVIAFR